MPLKTRENLMPLKTREIPKPHKDATERRDMRNERSKTWQMPDGKLRCETTLGAVQHYVSDDGDLRSCDTTIQQDGGKIFVDWLPYKFRLHDNGVGFDFISRSGGECSVSLSAIGGIAFDQNLAVEKTIADNVVTFHNVADGVDIVFKVLPNRVKTLRIIKHEKAPRSFAWLCEHDEGSKEKIGTTLIGSDAAGNQLELVSTVEHETKTSFVAIEQWTGKAKVRDRKTRIKSLSNTISYPVEIDPTVDNEIDNTVNDITDRNGTLYDSYLCIGRYGASLDVGLRWAGITVPNGATIDSATLSINVTSSYGGSFATGTVLGHDVDNAGAWAEGSIAPSTVPVTSATTSFARPTTTGVKTVNVATQVQEIVNRAGWVSGNVMSLVIRSTPGDYNLTFFEDYIDAGSNPASLSITYTDSVPVAASNFFLML